MKLLLRRTKARFVRNVIGSMVGSSVFSCLAGTFCRYFGSSQVLYDDFVPVGLLLGKVRKELPWADGKTVKVWTLLKE